MDTFQIFFSVFLILCESEELTTQNVTYYNTTKSWEEAVDFCFRNGGVLESNVTLLKARITSLKEEDNIVFEDIWVGKYRLLTNWTYIRGCFLIYGVFQHFVIGHSNAAELQCQLLCEKYTFYSLKGTDCYCIDDIDLFVRRKNCSCVGCYKVWEHQLPNFGEADKSDKCIAAKECNNGKLTRSYYQCNKSFDVTCDNDVELGYGYPKYKDAADECEIQGSFIKWHSDNLCVNSNNQIHQYWTSGKRKVKTFLLRKAYFTEHLHPERCFKLENNHTQKKDNCKKYKSFFCRFETDEDKGDLISIPNMLIPQQKNVQSDDSGKIAAGIVTSIMVVIAVMSVLVFIHRRRQSRKKPTIQESQNNSRLQDTVGLPSNYETSKAPVYHEIDADNFGPNNGKLNCSRAVNNITYDQVNSKEAPKSQNENQSANSSILINVNSNEHRIKLNQDGYEMAKVINVTGNSSEGANANNYCLAEPIATYTEEEFDPYDINKDYDHLNNVQKKEDQITKVYDHLPTAVTDDPTYDHSNLKSALDNEDYYDHFNNDGDHD